MVNVKVLKLGLKVSPDTSLVSVPWCGSQPTLRVWLACNSSTDVWNVLCFEECPGSGRSLWRREQLPTPVCLPGEFHGWRSLVGYSSWGHKELDTTGRLTLYEGTEGLVTSWSPGSQPAQCTIHVLHKYLWDEWGDGRWWVDFFNNSVRLPTKTKVILAA